MSEYNLNESGSQLPKENPFKNCAFYLAYLVTVSILVTVSWLIAKNSWIMVLWIFCIPCSIVGLITWAILEIKNRAVAFGVLFGMLTPFIVTFVATGGCGLVGV